MNVIISSAALALVLACNTPRIEEQQGSAPAPAIASNRDPRPVAPPPTNPSIERVEASQVCMVNNQHMGKPQIPVSVNGKTYYGCCAMCKGKLEREASARSATDPVNHRQVDKAEAIIGKLSNGDVLYFESQASFAAYR